MISDAWSLARRILFTAATFLFVHGLGQQMGRDTIFHALLIQFTPVSDYLSISVETYL